MSNVKTAMNEDEKRKALWAAVMAAIGTASVGAMVRDSRAKKERAKAEKVEGSKNAIVIPVKKTNFMKDLPTPRELAESRGEIGEPSEPKALPAPEESKLLPAPVTPQMAGAAMSDEDIKAMKRAILKARSVDFFKRASYKKAEDEEPKKDDVAETKGKVDVGEKENKAENKDEVKDESRKSKDEGRVYLRDQEGRFVSPTDPVGVAQAEKSAEFSFTEFIKSLGGLAVHPKDSARQIWESATGKPLVWTAGALGSVYLASLISDAINKKRREKSEQTLDEARGEYVNLLEEGNEKRAWGDVRDATGLAVGSAFFIPFAVTALITNRIIENRKKDAKRKKEMSDSYPDEPVILYKTSEDKSIEISPETALGLILMKKAMFEDVERLERGMEKKAFLPLLTLAPGAAAGAATLYGGGNPIKGVSDAWNGIKNLGKSYNSATFDDAVNTSVDILNDPNNHNLMLDLAKAYGDDNPNAINEAYANLNDNVYVPNKFKAWWTGQDKIMKDPEFRKKLVQNKRFQDALALKMNSDKDFINVRDNMIDNYLSGQWGLTQGGILHTILAWLAKNTGIGGYFVNKAMRDRLSQGIGGDQQGQQGAQEQSQSTGPLDQKKMREGYLRRLSEESARRGKFLAPTPTPTPTPPAQAQPTN